MYMQENTLINKLKNLNTDYGLIQLKLDEIKEHSQLLYNQITYIRENINKVNFIIDTKNNLAYIYDKNYNLLSNNKWLQKYALNFLELYKEKVKAIKLNDLSQAL